MSSIREAVEAVAEPANSAPVELDQSLLALLSEQLYRSPTKAVEELVVNGYDAAAGRCYVGIAAEGEDRFVCVIDDGDGMNEAGLRHLWHVGNSTKTGLRINKNRKQIGKFGIGKLASSAVGNTLLYVSKADGKIYASSFSFASLPGRSEVERAAESGAAGSSKAAEEPSKGGGEDRRPCVAKIQRVKSLTALQPVLDRIAGVSGAPKSLFRGSSWTVAVVEDYHKAAPSVRKIRNVLRSALPIASEFDVTVNGEEIKPSKEDEAPVVEFSVSELPEKRLDELKSATGQEWSVRGEALTCRQLPEGITGTVRVYQNMLRGKSDDLMRSHGFFVRVRGRLVNPDDALFGSSELQYKTLHRFRCEVEAPDLDQSVLSSREEVAAGPRREAVREVLVSCFREARQRWQAANREEDGDDKRKGEHERLFVAKSLSAGPVADVVYQMTRDSADAGTEPDGTSFYIRSPRDDEREEVVRGLYERGLDGLKFDETNLGTEERVARFSVADRTIEMNGDHAFVREYISRRDCRKLLEDFCISEVLLEVYLREARIPASVIGEMLGQRDELLRALVNAAAYSPESIAKFVADSANDERDLEVGLVRGMRVLGFNAKQLSEAGRPDGIASWHDFSMRQARRLSLEAKSSETIPDLPNIGFDALGVHARDWDAEGCLLLAPEFPGSSLGADSQAAKRAHFCGVSCWRIETFASAVRQAEELKITAHDILNIVRSHWAPDDVDAAVGRLLGETARHEERLTPELMRILLRQKGRLNENWKIDGVHMLMKLDDNVPDDWDVENTKATLAILQERSKGGVKVVGDEVRFLSSIDQVAQRVLGEQDEAQQTRSVSRLRMRQLVGGEEELPTSATDSDGPGHRAPGAR